MKKNHCLSVSLLSALAIIVFVASQSFAAGVEQAREYAKATNFKNEVEESVRSLTKNKQFASDEIRAVIDSIDFQSIEDAYVTALSNRLNDAELSALIKAAGIPHLQSALKKQSQAAVDCSAIILKQIQAAAQKQGIPLSGVNLKPQAKRP